VKCCYFDSQGDVLPTVGGGAQVVLTDVEVLKQLSPSSPRLSPSRKRSARISSSKENGRLQPDEVVERCRTGIEGHAKRACK
jgi:Arf6-interacting domain of mitotic kinesin-like protein 1